MRTLPRVLTFAISAGLLLAACAGVNDSGGAVGTIVPTAGAGTQMPTAPARTAAPGSSGIDIFGATPTAATASGATASGATPQASGGMGGSGEADLPGTPGAATPGAGTSAAGGSTASGGAIPQTGASQPQYVQLSNLLGMPVTGQAAEDGALGRVDGVLIDRPALSDGSIDAPGPRVSYVLVRADGPQGQSNGNDNGSAALPTSPASGEVINGGQMLVPFQAFDVATGGGDTTAGGNGQGQWLALTSNAAVAQNAPAFDAQTFNGQVSPEVAAYWAGQAPGIPATGPGVDTTQSVLVRGQIGALNVTDAQGSIVGQVRDLLVDAQTGEILYAVLSGGSAFNGRTYVVPMTVMNWQAGNGQGQGQGNALGAFALNAPVDVFAQAPALGSPDDLQNPSAWNSAVENFWNGMK